jgi:uncharacterized membrane protein YedE/YeeE
MKMLIYGLITGIVFGFLLQKGQVVRYDKQLGALRLIDLTIVKFMLSAVIVSMAGLYLFKDLGWAELSIKTTSLGANIIGGLIFGVGWGIVGYCPGTAVGALAEGRMDALAGIIGMLCGAALYAEMYPSLKTTVPKWGEFGKITLPGITGIGHWPLIGGLAVVFILLLIFFEKKNL